MKFLNNLFMWAFIMLTMMANAQPWTYDFGTTSVAAFSSTTASTTYLPAPSSGTSRVRCGTATTAAGSFTLANPGEAIGSGAELQMLSNAGSSSTTKFSIYDYTAGATGYVKFKITLNGGTNGVYTFWVGDGVSFSDNNAMANAQVFAGLRWSMAASNAVAYTVSGSTGTFGTTGITNSTGLFVQSLLTSYAVEVYMNNSAVSSTYGRSSVNYTLAAGTWDLWVDGVLVGDDLAKAGLTAGANFDSFAFNHQVSASAPGKIFLDDVEYSNQLPAPIACSAPALQASNITFPGNSTTTLDLTWTNGDGAGRVIKMNTANSFTAPVNGSNPTANLNYTGSGEQVIYNGTGTGPITVTGLSQSTTYYFQVYEYCSPNRNYQTATATGNPNSQTTAAGASLSANSLTPFGSQCTGGTYGPNSFTLTGVNLTTADITVSSALSVYQFATSNTGPFSSSLTLSQAGGSYAQDIYVQYSPISAGTSSGNIVISGGGSSSINVAVSGTGISAAIPTLTTPASSLVTYNSATLGATISSINCSDVVARGIEWSTTNNFTNGSGTTVQETGVFGVGDFSFNVTGLIPNQTFYWKAFVTNSSGTVYSAQQSFTTAQQYLSVGDLSILGFNTTNPDEFVFVNWAPITRNMVIKFTDNGFNAAASATLANNARGGENFVIWKNNTGADIDPGTVIKINGASTTTGQIISGGLSAITTTDQIFAYQGAATTGANPDWASNLNPTTYTGTILYGLNIGTTGFLTTGTAASTSSYLPTELSVPNGSIAITGTVAGSQYTATRSALGSIIAYRNLVNNPTNWTTATSGTITLDVTPFTVNPNVATQIAVTGVNSGINPSANTPFAISFETRDANGAAASVGIDTDFSVSVGTGTGAVGGTLTGTILAGSGTLTISGVTYNTAESNVTLSVNATSGQSLTAGTSAPFTVDSAATHLTFVSLENFLYTGNAAPTFTVQARRDNGSVDVNYNGTATVAITSGTGTLLGTITKSIVNGVASFTDIAFDEPGIKQIQVSATGLTSGLSASITVSTATLTELVLPQFIEGAQPSNSNRLPFVYRVSLGGLKPNSTYRYYNSVVVAADAASSNGAGNCIFANASGFIRTASTSLATAGNYGEFTTNASGEYAGWFITEPTGNATRFNPGSDVFPRIILNNGNGGTTAALRLTTSNSVRVLDLGTGANQGTGLRGTSLAGGLNFVFVYNNTEGTGRPLSGSFIEGDGTANSAANSYASFYATSVDGISGAYGMIIPNNLTAGIRRIESRDLVTGDLSGCASTDADGIWPSGANTINPNTGTTAKVITVTDAPLVPSPESCANYIDDDCDGLVDEACPGNFANDIPSGAINMSYSVNQNYPNCQPITGDNTLANNSAESAAFDGPDSWYRFVAYSTAATIYMTSTTMDNAIALYSRAGLVYTLIDSENSNATVGGFERLSVSGLTIGQTYYVSAGAASGSTGGSFSLCVQHLMPSSCAYTIPAEGFNICSSFKAVYRGSATQGVTYGFSFTGTGGGATGTTSLSGTNGLIALSNPTLALRYGGIYNARVDVNYALTRGDGSTENISILGTSTGNCAGVFIRTQPRVEVKSTQRCPAALTRSMWLVGTTVINDPSICGAISYTFEFSQEVSCADSTTISLLPSLFTSAGNTPYLGLGVLPNLPGAGTWRVRIRPNFAYGPGQFGPARRILVNGTSASGMLAESGLENGEERKDVFALNDMIYPNPSQGDVVRVQFMNLQSEQVRLRVIDAMGREVYSMSFSVDGALNTALTFQEALATGVYTVQLQDGAETRTERLVVSK